MHNTDKTKCYDFAFLYTDQNLDKHLEKNCENCVSWYYGNIENDVHYPAWDLMIWNWYFVFFNFLWLYYLIAVLDFDFILQEKRLLAKQYNWLVLYIIWIMILKLKMYGKCTSNWAFRFLVDHLHCIKNAAFTSCPKCWTKSSEIFKFKMWFVAQFPYIMHCLDVHLLL